MHYILTGYNILFKPLPKGIFWIEYQVLFSDVYNWDDLTDIKLIKFDVKNKIPSI